VNTGVLLGSGTVGNVLDNAEGGEVLVMTGDAITFTGSGNTNAGEINLLGGAVTFDQDLINDANGTINGRGTLTVTGGLANYGRIRFAGGSSNVYGDVDNSGEVIVTGGTTADIHDPLQHTAGEIRVSEEGHLTTHSDANAAAGAEANITGVWTALGGITSAGDIELIDGGQVNGEALVNTGLLHGDGNIGNPMANQAGGEVRVGSGQRLRLTAAGCTNGGLIRNNGGAMVFREGLVSDANGVISGAGLFDFDGGLTLQGTMSLDSGVTDVFGPVYLSDANNSFVTVATGAHATFCDDVDHDGNEISVAASARVVFFGDVTGDGDFTGSGEVIFEGTYSPGNSPAAVSFEGDVSFGSQAVLAIEIGGPAAGDDHDQVNIGGELSADGTLLVSLLDGYEPAVGEEYVLLNFAEMTGKFDLSLPDLPGGLDWLTDCSAGSLALSVELLGDADRNGVVDAADYIALKRNLGAASGAGWGEGDFDADGDVDWSDLAILMGNLGQKAGGSSGTIPEPATLLLSALGVPAVLRRRGSIARR